MPMMKHTMTTLIGYTSSFKVVTMNIKSHQRWIKEINKYINNQTDEEVINLDLEFVDDNIYNHLLQEVLKNPLMLIVINNYDRASYNMQKRINYLMKNAKEYNSKGQEISFHNTIFIINFKTSTL